MAGGSAVVPCGAVVADLDRQLALAVGDVDFGVCRARVL